MIAGKKGWHFDEIFHTAASLNLGSSVLFTGYIDEADKPALMRGASLFVYPRSTRDSAFPCSKQWPPAFRRLPETAPPFLKLQETERFSSTPNRWRS